MRAIQKVCLFSLLLMADPVAYCRGGGGGHGGGGHCGGGGGFHAGGGGGFHATTGTGHGSYSFGFHRGYIRPWMNNEFVDDEPPPYHPMGPSAAGGNVDPTLTRNDFVKTYNWAKM